MSFLKDILISLFSNALWLAGLKLFDKIKKNLIAAIRRIGFLKLQQMNILFIF
jgi:hypothetical protein